MRAMCVYIYAAVTDIMRERHRPLSIRDAVAVAMLYCAVLLRCYCFFLLSIGFECRFAPAALNFALRALEMRFTKWNASFLL